MSRQAEAVALCANNQERIQRALEVAPDMALHKKESDLIQVIWTPLSFPLRISRMYRWRWRL